MKLATVTFPLIAVILLMSVNARAGVWQGQIRQIQLNSGVQGGSPANNAFVYLDDNATYLGTRPSCASKTAFFFDPTTIAGNMIMKTLIAARLAGATVLLLGTGTCTSTGAFEDLSQVQF